MQFHAVGAALSLAPSAAASVAESAAGIPAAPDRLPPTSPPDSGSSRRACRATIQDLGRPGSADLGVTTAGALDRGALRQANRLAGNPVGAAGIEVARRAGPGRAADQVLAVAGAPSDLAIARRRRRGSAERTVLAPFALLAGETLEPRRSRSSGCAAMWPSAAGWMPPPVLGSRSTDTMSGIGPGAAGRRAACWPRRRGRVRRRGGTPSCSRPRAPG